jgi:hypothetical protein
MRVDVDARNSQLHAGPVIPVLVTVTVPIDPLVHDLVPVMLVDASGPANVLAANLTADAGDRLRDAQLLGRTGEPGCTRQAPGIRLARGCARKRNGRNRY